MKVPSPNLWPPARTGQRWLLRARRREALVDGHRMIFLERGNQHPAGQRWC